MTNDTLDLHRPTTEFRDYLEGEVVREYRRRRVYRRLRAAAVIIVSAGIGMSATLASAQVRTNSQRDSLREALKAESYLAMTRLELAKAQLAEQQRQVSAGVRPSVSLVDAGLEVRIAEEEVARIALNGREIEGSGLPPRDELNAPLVKGEDFVKQRIENRLMTVMKRLQAAEQKRSEVSRRVAAGVASDLELGDADLDVARAQADFAVLAARAQARKDFLEKSTPIDALMQRVERTEVQQAVVVAQHSLANAQKRLDLVSRRVKAGAATDVDLLRAQLEVRVREVDLQKAAQRLKQIR